MFDIVTIGTATRDAFVKSKDFHIDYDSHVLGGKALCMPLGAKLEISEIVFSTGGGATNTAVTFARQGFRVACISRVGNDVSGQTVKRELEKEGVHTEFLLTDNLPTAYSILLHEPGGERTILVYRGASEHISTLDIPWSKIKTRWFYLSSVAGNLSILKKVIQVAKLTSALIAYNPGGRELKQHKKLAPFLIHTAILIANREEAALITGAPYRDIKKIFKIWDKMSPGINVMTDARNGVWVSDGKFLYKAGIYKEKKIADRTGAGDAFGSGFVAGILRKAKSQKSKVESLSPDDIEYAIKLGSANATSKVEGIGAKYGLLTQRQFERDQRWKNLRITISKI